MSDSNTDIGSTPGEELPWYVYDRYAHLLHIAVSLSAAEAWALQHWGVVEDGDRRKLAENDYFYLLLVDKPAGGEFRSRDFQARIMRKDRVIELNRDPLAAPQPSR